MLGKSSCTITKGQPNSWGSCPCHCRGWGGSDVHSLTLTCKEIVSMFHIHDNQVTMEQPFHCVKIFALRNLLLPWCGIISHAWIARHAPTMLRYMVVWTYLCQEVRISDALYCIAVVFCNWDPDIASLDCM